MLAMKLDGDYFLTADEHNITLCTKRKPKDDTTDGGNTKRKVNPVNVIGYYSTLLGALKGYRHICLREGINASKTLDDLRKYMEAFDERIVKAMKWEDNFNADVMATIAKRDEELKATRETGALKKPVGKRKSKKEDT